VPSHPNIRISRFRPVSRAAFTDLRGAAASRRLFIHRIAPRRFERQPLAGWQVADPLLTVNPVCPARPTEESCMTLEPGVFAAGYMRRGQSLVVCSIAEGRKAARGMERFLSAQAG
jgi:hypothetical protein